MYTYIYIIYIYCEYYNNCISFLLVIINVRIYLIIEHMSNCLKHVNLQEPKLLAYYQKRILRIGKCRTPVSLNSVNKS